MILLFGQFKKMYLDDKIGNYLFAQIFTTVVEKKGQVRNECFSKSQFVAFYKFFFSSGRVLSFNWN